MASTKAVHSVSVGLWICALATPLYAMLIGREYKKAAAAGKSHAKPEAMLWWAMIAAPLLPICLFWIAWFRVLLESAHCESTSITPQDTLADTVPSRCASAFSLYPSRYTCT